MNDDMRQSMATAGMQILFEDHMELNDFIMEKNMLEMRLRTLITLGKNGTHDANHECSVWLRNFIKAMRAELDELEESVAWKWWRPQGKTDMQNVRVEIVDIFHFLLSAAMASGMSGEDFAKVYYGKRKLNFDRQKDGFKPGDNEAAGIGKL